MTDDKGDEELGDSIDAAASRRSLLKKAAVAPLVAGAVWVAPRVENLSVVPDVAAAQSGGTIVPFTVDIPPGTTAADAPFPFQISATNNVFNFAAHLNIDVGTCVFAGINEVKYINTVLSPFNTVGLGDQSLDVTWAVDVQATQISGDILCT